MMVLDILDGTSYSCIRSLVYIIPVRPVKQQRALITNAIKFSNMSCLFLRLPARAKLNQPNKGVTAVTGDEVADRVHGVFPLPLGMEREDRCG